MDARELRRHLKALRQLQEGGWDEVYIQMWGDRWFPVNFWRMASGGMVEVDDPSWVNPPKTMLVPARDVRLSNPDEEVTLQRPVRVKRYGQEEGRSRGGTSRRHPVRARRPVRG